MQEKPYIEVDELDFRLGLTDLLSVHGKIDKETSQLINTVIAETKHRAMKIALNAYIDKGQKMDFKNLMEEDHKSERLGKFLETQGYSRPDENFEAHALVSGGHSRAKVAREILAQFKIRIDEPFNGLWLPNYKKNMNLYPEYSRSHSSIHRKVYYLNITACLEQAMSPMHARGILRKVAQGLVTGSFPIEKRMKTREIMEVTKV
jgi:A nuclease family of the HNH/ENDO VII superfamily with conserved AHH